MSSIINFLNHSILHSLFHFCNSLLRGGVKRLPLLFASFLLMAAALLTIPLVATMPAYANETTIDLWQSFPDNQGDNGFFAYGYAPATNTYRLLSDCGSYHFCRPEEPNWNNPHAFKSGGVNGWLGEPWVGLAPSGTVSNTGSPEDAVLAWVVPNAAYYQVNGSFYVYPQSANGADLYIKQNTKILWSYHLPPGATQDFNVTASLFNTGDKLYFEVDAHNDVYFSEYNDWPFVKGQIQMVSALCGDTLKILCSYEFSLEQGAQKTDSIQLLNPGTVPRTATLEVISPHSDLTVSFSQSNPITIAPGETKTLSLDLNASTTPVGVYDDLLLKVNADDGSTLYAGIKVNIVPSGTGQLPDLTITANDISSVTNADDSVTLTAAVRNRGLSPATNIQVRFYEFDNPLGEPIIAQIAPNGIGNASIIVPAITAGDHLIRVVVDPMGAIAELNEANNEASRLIPIGSPNPTAENILVTGSLPATVYTNSLFTLTGRAVYDLYVNGVRNTDYVVKGGSVQITVKGDGGAQWVYGDVYTDVEGNFAKALQAPASPGTYRITMTVTDKTFIGTRELVFVVTEPGPTPPFQAPPAEWGTGHFEWDGVASQWVWVWTNLLLMGPAPQQDVFVYSKDLNFSKNNPAASEEITVFAAIRYWASSSALIAENVPVNVYVTYPGTPKVKIGQTLLKSLAVGSPDFGARYVYATWKNPGEGIYLIEFEIDPSYVEVNRLNNAATRAIIVGQFSGISQGAISGQVIAPLGGLGNVMIQVLDANGQQIGNAITDPTGFYLVGNVPPGTVQVRIVTPSGYVPDAEMKTVAVVQQEVRTVDFYLAAAVTPDDTTPPTLVCPPDLTITQGQPVNLGIPTVSDDVDAAPQVANNAPASFPLGATTVIWTATDASGNQATCAQQVTIEAQATICDVDADGDIDQSDLSLISRGRGQVPQPGDPRDANGDGLINPSDVKACIPQCTRPNCATQ